MPNTFNTFLKTTNGVAKGMAKLAIFGIIISGSVFPSFAYLPISQVADAATVTSSSSSTSNVSSVSSASSSSNSSVTSNTTVNSGSTTGSVTTSNTAATDSVNTVASTTVITSTGATTNGNATASATATATSTASATAAASNGSSTVVASSSIEATSTSTSIATSTVGTSASTSTSSSVSVSTSTSILSISTSTSSTGSTSTSTSNTSTTNTTAGNGLGDCAISQGLTASSVAGESLTPKVGDIVTYELMGAPAFTATTTVTVTNVLPAGLTFVSSTATMGSFDSAANVWNVGTGNITGAIYLTVTAQVSAGYDGQSIAVDPNINYVQSNCTQTSAAAGFSFAVQPAATPTSTVQYADLSIVKTANVTSTVEGGTVNYTVAVTDLGPATSTGVVATDTLPAGLNFVSATSSEGSYVSSTGIWTIGDIAASSTATLNITATVKSGEAGQIITNLANVSESASTTDSNMGNNSSSVSISVAPTSTVQYADLSITKTADVTSTTEGGTINYTVAVTDLGPATSTGVVATDTLPAGVTFVSATSSEGSYVSSTGIWTIGDMPASTTATLTIATKVNSGTAGTTITNVANVSESASTTDNNLGNNSSSVSVSIPSNGGGGCTSNCGGIPSADLSVTKTADVTSTVEGGTIHYTVSVTDNGPATSTGVSVTDVVPAGLTFVSATSSEGSYVSSTGIWTIGDMPASTTATLNVAATVNSGEAGKTITNIAIASESASSTDGNMGNNSSTVSIPVATNGGGGGTTPTADLAITKTVDNASPVGGTNVTYTVTVTDNGPATSSMVVANDALPIGLAMVSATTSQGTYNMGNGVWDIGTLSANATATLIMVAAVSPSADGTTITNTATVTSTLTSIPDPNPANNSSSVSINVQSPSTGGGGCTSNCGGGGGGNTPTAEIGITKTVDNANPNPGDTIHYTLTVNATGPSTSFGVVANDVLPSGVTFVSATPSEGSYVNSTGVWTVGTVNVGQNATLIITATVNAGTNGEAITNTGTVSESPSVVDQLSGNNTASVTINVGGNGGGGGGGGTTVGVGSGGGGGGSVLGASTSTGQVLGASCGLYLTQYIHPVRKYLNDPVQVKKLQVFLNMNLGLTLPVDGYYSDADIAAVNRFQTKYHSEVLAPWVPLGLPTEFTPTSYVYQTTQRWINLIMCPPLNIPLPTLVVDKGGE